MLSTDMCLAYDANPDANGCGNDCYNYKDSGSPLLAQNHNCCAWVEIDTIFEMGIYSKNDVFDYCGTLYTPSVVNIDIGGGGNRDICCQGGLNGENVGSFGDCDMIDEPFPQGPAYDAVVKFASNEATWVRAYLYSWDIAVTNGYYGLWEIGSGEGLSNFKGGEDSDYGCEADFE